MDQSDNIKNILSQLFEAQRLAVLATHRDGQPYASLVAFAADKDLKRIYFVTPTATRKFTNLLSEPRVAMLINSSENDPSDFHRAVAVTVKGSVEIIKDQHKDAILEHYLKKHPYLSDFARSPSCALLCVHVKSYYLVRNFQHVMELHFDEEVA